jgi:hypothetical protein
MHIEKPSATIVHHPKRALEYGSPMSQYTLLAIMATINPIPGAITGVASSQRVFPRNIAD